MKTVLVFGGCGLIGKAIVNRLGDDGDRVYVCDPKAENTIRWWTQKDKKGIGIEGGAIVNAAYPKAFRGHIDFFINTTTDFAEWFSENGGGVIVNLASIYGIIGPDDRLYEGTEMSMPAWYAAAKGAIIAHSRCMAVKYAFKNVRINCISPGGVENNQSESFVKKYCERVPMRRMATPDDISGVVSFLLSDDAKYITGQNIVVDGGLTAGI